VNVVYRPTGAAGEYAELACNLYLGCVHGCRYCYSPATQRQKPERFHAGARPRPTVLRLLRRDLSRCGPGTPRVLLSFLSDPYQPEEAERGMTREALCLFREARVPVGVLTKAGELPKRDLDLLAETGAHLGVSLSWTDDADRAEWEPNAGTVAERVSLLRTAHDAGIRTWVSVEPVVDSAQALAVVRELTPWVDEWRVGKLTKHEAAKRVDWRTFTAEVYALLRSTGRAYLLKASLAPYLPLSAELRRPA